MTILPLDGPLTRREFYLEITVVWLFILLVSTSVVDGTGGWREMVLPIGAFLMVMLHSLAMWRATRRERSAGKGAS